MGYGESPSRRAQNTAKTELLEDTEHGPRSGVGRRPGHPHAPQDRGISLPPSTHCIKASTMMVPWAKIPKRCNDLWTISRDKIRASHKYS